MAGTWEPLQNQPKFNTSTMFLLSDGRIMVQEEGTAHWHALTPDSTGSYVKGTWSDLADMSFWRRYYASGMLKDGRIIIVGGEQSGDVGDTNKGEIYDPVADTWTSIPTPPGWSIVGDAVSCILPDGRLMIGALGDGSCIIYNPVTNSWTNAASKAVRSNEETWILQRDGTIVTAQCWSPYHAEKYIISSDTWQNEGSPGVTLVDSTMHEIGPAMLCYNGKTIFFGAAKVQGVGKTAIYTRPSMPTGVGTWAAGPDIPQVDKQTMVCNDCPASLLPNGKVLLTGAQWLDNSWGTPIHFFEYDPVANTITHVTDPANNNQILYMSRLMLLPTGQVMFSPSSKEVQVYTPDGGPEESWRPTITSVTPHYSNQIFANADYYTLQGTQLNGLSQANTYGDDCQPATNYPLVRLSGGGKVYYARTYNFSTMGVSTGASLQSTRFDLSGVPYGTYDLVVVANGISSHVFSFNYAPANKPFFVDHGVKREFEFYGKLLVEGDPLNWLQWVVDPQIGELKQQVRQLEKSVQRLTSLIMARELPQVGREIAEAASQKKQKTTE